MSESSGSVSFASHTGSHPLLSLRPLLALGPWCMHRRGLTALGAHTWLACASGPLIASKVPAALEPHSKRGGTVARDNFITYCLSHYAADPCPWQVMHVLRTDRYYRRKLKFTAEWNVFWLDHGSVKGMINCSVEYMIKSVHCAVLLVCKIYEWRVSF